MTKQIMGLAFLVLMMTGCNQRMTEVVIDPNMSLERQERVIEAAEDWFAYVPEARVPIRIGENVGTGFVTEIEVCPSPSVAGFTDISAVVYLCKDRAHLDHKTIRHELGHALSGRGDHLNVDSVMHKYVEHQPNELMSVDEDYVRSTL